MIRDTLANASWYRTLGNGIFEALEFLRTADLSKLPDGRHDIDGDRLFAIVQRYRPKPLAQANWEAHRRYIDVQYVLDGIERMGYLPLSDDLAVRQPYDAAKDLVLFDARGDLFEVSAGGFAVFLPQDVHAPGLACERFDGEVRKLVLKCRVDELVAACGLC